ncbi:hypothetical protein DYQ86_15745 [Acidobacteria bacterium AB60]|nr:hypothetical protein DYQ86_15745 [Acidobacteria bacterium AB60]
MTRPNPFLGNWVYRSLINTTDPVQKIDDLLLWEANLSIGPDGPDLISGVLSSNGYTLEVRGAVDLSQDEPRIQMRATGIDRTATAGWIYDYSGYLTSRWPEGDRQVPAIVGTVIRTVPHAPNRPAGASYSFVAVSKEASSAVYQLPAPVTAHFADRVHRLHHAVWHGIREAWEDLTAKQQEQLRDLDWQVEGGRIALVASQKTRPALENGSGEDFLFFHRQMVAHYRMMMDSIGAERLEWIEIPQPGSESNHGFDAVPPGWNIPDAVSFQRRLSALKTDEYFWTRMRWWEVKFKDSRYLATLTLGELGALLQYTIHNDMHIRWSAAPRDPETNAWLPLGRPDPDISEKWDNPRYDWLGEFYSSHVNPIFWRLHGWIDDRIVDWAQAHEHYHPGSLEPRVLGGVDWFKPGKWVGVDYPWVWPRELGGIDSGMGDDTPEMRQKKIKSMTAVMNILYSPASEAKIVSGETAGPSKGKLTKRRTSVIGLE